MAFLVFQVYILWMIKKKNGHILIAKCIIQTMRNYIENTINEVVIVRTKGTFKIPKHIMCLINCNSDNNSVQKLQ